MRKCERRWLRRITGAVMFTALSTAQALGAERTIRITPLPYPDPRGAIMPCNCSTEKRESPVAV